MAHNINVNENTGKASFFSRKEIPWHGLGTILDKEIVTAKEAMKAASLDFTVEKRKLYIKTNEGKFRPSPTYEATVRTDTEQHLGVVGTDYEILQNAECFDFIDSLIMGGEASFETAGALGNGERVFVTAKLPKHVTLGNGDTIEEYVFITTSHDGSKAVIAALTPIRIVCNNTLTMALSRNKNKVMFKHTKNLKTKLEMAHQLMGISNKYFDEFNELMQSLKSVKVASQKEVTDLASRIILTNAEYDSLAANKFNFHKALSSRKANIMRDILVTVDEGIGQEYHRGTGLWLMNGITSYYQNTRDYRTDETKLNALSEGKYVNTLTAAVPILLAHQSN